MSYDAFLSYSSLDRPVVLKVADALKDRDCTCFLDQWYLTPGLDWVTALEKALAASRSVAVFLGSNELGRWQQRELAWALDQQADNGRFPVIPILLPGCQPPLGFLRQLMWIDLRDDPCNAAQLDRLVAAIRGETITAEGQPRPQATVCPYRGLLHFREEDAAFFFGRDTYIQQLVALVERRNLVAVVGASGIGKSSVVRAGLVPELRKRDRRPVWEIVTMVPGEKPLDRLADALLPLVEPQLSGTDLIRKAHAVATDLRKAELPLWRLVEAAWKAQQGSDRLLLVVDQWEELYRECKDSDSRQRFVEELLAATASARSPLSVVFTVRSDFYGELLQDRQLLDRLLDAKVDLGPMTTQELRQAITQPAEAVGLTFQDGLVDRLLADACEEPGYLPLLEFALEGLWQRSDGGRLTHQAYEKLGRLSGAIAARAETVFSELTATEQAAAPGLFRRLVHAGTKMDEDTRRRADLRSLDEASQGVVRLLADQRLLVTARAGGEDTSRETVEVAHEALLRRWSRLREWVDADRMFLQWRDRLAPLLDQYQRDPQSALLRLGALREAREFYPARQVEMEEAERTFVAASIDAAWWRKFRLCAALIVVCAILVGSWQWNRHDQNRRVVDQTIARLSDPLLTVVPPELDNLQAAPAYARRRLEEDYRVASEPRPKLRLAYGLIAVGAVTNTDHDVARFILDQIAVAQADDSANLVEGLSRLSDQDVVLQQLRQRAETASATDPAARNRYLVAALSLGDKTAAEEFQIIDGDPSRRTRLIRDFPDWPGDLHRIAQLLPQIDDADARSGLCIAIGGVDLNSRSLNERRSIVEAVKRLFPAKDSGTHSATRWALRQWKQEPPKVQRCNTEAEREQWTKDHSWYVNSLGMTMVRIPAGKYRIGSEREPDNPPRDVEVSEFWLSDCAVTVEQFRALLPEVKTPQIEKDASEPAGFSKPVSDVTWYDAVEFCIRLSKEQPYYRLTVKERDDFGSIRDADVKILRGNGYRLPEEKEWEVACRATTVTEFSFGDDEDDLFDYAWFNINSWGRAHPVAEKRPNVWGLYDMHGNVFEWCEDTYEVSYRVNRGGGWFIDASNCRSAGRFSRGVPGGRDDGLGFRLARTNSSSPAAR